MKVKMHLPADWSLRFSHRVEKTDRDKRKSRNSKVAQRELRNRLKGE